MSALPESIIKAFKEQKLLPLIGAGVSMSLRNTNGKQLFPNWNELLLKIADKIEQEEDRDNAEIVRLMVKTKKYKQAAQIARESLRGSLWNNFFAEQFSISKDQICPDSTELTKAIWRLNNTIINLNYDHSLKFSAPEDPKLIDNSSIAELKDLQVMSATTPTIWHLHGHIDKKDSLVFTDDNYESLYGNCSRFKAAINTFKSKLTTKSLLFVGCSLDDIDILQKIHEQNELFNDSTGPHYALVHKAEKETIQSKIKGFNIILIDFEDFGKPLIEVIESLTAHTTVQSDTPVQKLNINTADEKIEEITRIAVLTANPITKDYDYSKELSQIKKFPAEIDIFNFSLDTLCDLDSYKHIFILTKVIRNKLVIEGEFLEEREISIDDLADNLDDEIAGVFIVTKDEISLTNTNVSIPIAILDKVDNSTQRFIFKKPNLKKFPYKINDNSFKLSSSKTKTEVTLHKSRLPNEIDPRNSQNFVGRKSDLEVICKKILDLKESKKVLTVKGSGGLGKTSIIKKVAIELAGRNFFNEGIDFIDCEHIKDFKEFENKTARLFDLEFTDNITQSIQNLDSEKDALLILDNFETLIHHEDFNVIKDYLHIISNYVPTAITSRELLDIDIEDYYELRPFTSDEAEELFIQEIKVKKAYSETDRKILREEILEPLLGNNPLAIKLITKNIPKGKKLLLLKEELENNFFEKIDSQTVFTQQSDFNIEHKNSLYHSIDYSYKRLSQKEKSVFELLSLFPDGIDLEDLKKISDKSYKEKIKNISDIDIKSLENKSIVENNKGLIRLQSIVRKFSDLKLKNNVKKQELELSAFEYNLQFCKSLYKSSKENSLKAISIYHRFKNNFIKTFSFLEALNIEENKYFSFVNNIAYFTIAINDFQITIEALGKVLKPLKINPANQKKIFALELCQICLQFFDGDFHQSSNKLRKLITLEEISSLPRNSDLNLCIKNSATNIYAMEGESFFEAKYQYDSKTYNTKSYSPSLFSLGVFSQKLLKHYSKNKPYSFFQLDLLLNIGKLSASDIQTAIEETFHKDHLEKCQLTYLKAKLNLTTRKEIKELATVNPYTVGLKKLMFAFHEENHDTAKKLYLEALKKLEHIKYYYTEALLFFSRYLKSIGANQEYQNYSKKGVELAKKHHYRFLQHSFKNLIDNTNLPYDEQKYPLPDGVDFNDYIDRIIKDGATR